MPKTPTTEAGKALVDETYTDWRKSKGWWRKQGQAFAERILAIEAEAAATQGATPDEARRFMAEYGMTDHAPDDRDAVIAWKRHHSEECSTCGDIQMRDEGTDRLLLHWGQLLQEAEDTAEAAHDAAERLREEYLTSDEFVERLTQAIHKQGGPRFGPGTAADSAELARQIIRTLRAGTSDEGGG